MIQTQEAWMVDEASAVDVERVVDAVYEILKGTKTTYTIVHIGDLLVQLGSAAPNNNPLQDEEVWIKAIYTAVRKGRIAFLSGDPEHFAGNLHPLDHEEDPEDQTMLNSVIREPNGTVQIFVILRDW